jgi:hypothetical protein
LGGSLGVGFDRDFSGVCLNNFFERRVIGAARAKVVGATIIAAAGVAV